MLCKFFGEYDYFWVLPGSKAVRRFRCSQYTELAKAAPETERYDAIVEALQWEGSVQQKQLRGQEAPPASKVPLILKSDSSRKDFSAKNQERPNGKGSKAGIFKVKSSGVKAKASGLENAIQPAPHSNNLSTMDKLLLLSDAVCTMLDEEKKPSSSKSKRKKGESISEDDEDETGVRRSKRPSKVCLCSVWNLLQF